MLNEAQRELFQRRNFAHIATVMPDGSPQVSPVWVTLDGDDIIVNTAEGRVKTRNVRRDPRVAISVHDQDDPYTRVCVRGVVTDLVHEGADASIDSLAHKYTGDESYRWHDPNEQRVILRIRPDHIAS